MTGLIVNKLLSARFLMAVSFSLAACYGFVKGRIDAQVFVPLVLIIVKDYFTRSDRKPEETNGAK